MNKRVVLVHTSFALLGSNRMLYDIFEELLPDVELINIVDDAMLKEVMAGGRITPGVTRRMCYYFLAAEAMGVDAIFAVCSSLGPATDVARELVSIPVVKIDEAMAEKVAREGRRIGVLATVATTLGPTAGLIEHKAEGVGRQLEIRQALCEGAFELLMSGDVDAHNDMIATRARELSEWADALVLAQSTMTRLAPRLAQETGLPVWTSPRLGVEHLKQVLSCPGQ